MEDYKICGIIGLIRRDVKKSAFKFGDAIYDMLFMDTLRGYHSTGLFVKDWDSTRKEWFINYHKQAISGVGFVNSKEFNQVMSPSTNIMFAVGHNRAATVGKVNDENSHPFFTENLTGVHNGSLKGSWRYDLKAPADVEVDSHAIYTAINKEGIQWTIDRINGAYSLVWYDDRNDTLNFLRNSERPMWFVESDEFVGFGSEKHIIAAAMERNGMKVTGFEELPPHVHVSIDVSGRGGEVAIEAYTPKELWKTTTYVGNIYQGGKATTVTGNNSSVTEIKPNQTGVTPTAYVPKYTSTDLRTGEMFWRNHTINTRLPREAYPLEQSDPEKYIGQTVVFSAWQVDETRGADGYYRVLGEMLIEPEDGATIEVITEISPEAMVLHKTVKLLFFGVVSGAKISRNGLSLELTMDKAACTNTVDPFAIGWLKPSDFPLKRTEAKQIGYTYNAMDNIKNNSSTKFNQAKEKALC